METIQSFATLKPEHLTPDHVGGLSLGEVTDTYGTLGLLHRLNRTLTETELFKAPEVAWAMQFGLMLHANDTRTNGHYTDHLMRVTLRIIEHYGIIDPALTAASMMHDGPEDHPRDICFALTKERIRDEREARARAFELLPEFMGEEASGIVAVVTNPLIEPDQDKEEIYFEHTKLVVAESPKGRVLKVSDFTDNGVGNHYTLGPKQHTSDLRYLRNYRTHEMGLFMPDSLITGETRAYVLQQLTEGHARSLARIAMKA